MKQKVNKDTATKAGIAVLLIALAGGGGYALAPGDADLLSDCSITIAGEETACLDAVEALNNQARVNDDTLMMLDRQRLESICLNAGGQFDSTFQGCVVGEDAWLWSSDDGAFKLEKTL